jgi:hypothetical protein
VLVSWPREAETATRFSWESDDKCPEDQGVRFLMDLKLDPERLT